MATYTPNQLYRVPLAERQPDPVRPRKYMNPAALDEMTSSDLPFPTKKRERRGDGVCARIKEELLRNFNLHTIVRLPNGVFAPYTSIPTNLLFFDRSGPTREVWYYEHPLPEGRKNYTKTQPLRYEEFETCLAWRSRREENDRAWRVPAEELLAANCNLDRKNPNAKNDLVHRPPEELVASIVEKEQRITEILGRIKVLLEKLL